MNEILEQLRALVEAAVNRAVQDRDLNPRFVDGVLVTGVQRLLTEALGEVDQTHSVDRGLSSLMIHYTGVDTIVAMLRGAAKQRDAFLRLNASSTFNDPDEGRFFTKNLAIPTRHRWVKERDTSHAYMVSFIIPDEKVDLSDNLMFWRTYGREGEGCSLVLSVPQARLRKVKYGVRHIKDVRAILLPFLDILLPLVTIEVDPLRTSIRTRLSEVVWGALAGIKYLYKSDAYGYERECRVVVPEFEVPHDAISFVHDERDGVLRGVKHYIEDPDLTAKRILATDSRIVLGPCVDRPYDLGFYLETLKRLGGWPGRDPRITKSRIVYRRT